METAEPTGLLVSEGKVLHGDTHGNTYASWKRAEAAVSTAGCKVPSEIKVSNVAKSGKVHLSWKKDKDADKYRVYWSTSKNGSFKLIATVKENSFVQAKADLEQGSGSRSL